MHIHYPLPERNRVASFDGEGFCLHEGAFPEPAEDEVLFRALAWALEPGDLDPERRPSRPHGPSLAAEVAATGDRARGWSPLDRAAIDWGARPADAAGPQALPEYFRLPVAWIRRGVAVKLPLDIPADAGAVAPTAARVVRALREMRLGRDGPVVVAGLGLPGQMAVHLARHRAEAPVIAADPSATRRERARWAGAGITVNPDVESLHRVVLEATEGRGAEAVLLGGVEPIVAREALAALAPGGTLAIVEPPHEAVRLIVTAAELWRREARILGIAHGSAPAWRECWGFFRSGVLDPEALVPARAMWRDLPGFRTDDAARHHGLGVIVEGPER